MDFQFTVEQETFRQEVREFLREVLPPDWNGIDPDAYFTDEWWPLVRYLTGVMAEKGWLTVAWPAEYGGKDLPHLHQVVYNEEMSYHRVPTRDTSTGISLVGPLLMLHGTEEQKRRFLPRIASGEYTFCQGFSEPEAGSDLASLKTTAVADGDDFIINGSKIWTSGAHMFNWCYLLARTDPEAPKHRGISCFLADMSSPGITVTPILNMLKVHYFNQIFFDNVRVPKENLIGEINRGWYQAAASLDFERSGSGRYAAGRRTLEELVELAREARGDGEPLARNPLIRHRLAELYIANEAGRQLGYRIAYMQSRGQIPNKEASMSKLFGSELAQQIAQLGMQMIGLYGNLDKGSKWAVLNGRLAWHYVDGMSYTIRAGTSEIQRNIIATRGLGLPRD